MIYTNPLLLVENAFKSSTALCREGTYLDMVRSIYHIMFQNDLREPTLSEAEPQGQNARAPGT